MDVLLINHLGMGDQIVLNGMIRKMLTDNNELKIFLPTLIHNQENVKYMFRDLKRLKTVPVESIVDMNSKSARFCGKIISTFSNSARASECYKGYYLNFFEDSFYHVIGMNPKIKTEYFHIERNYAREIEVYNELTKDIDKKAGYIFMHEDRKRGIIIDRSKIRWQIPIVDAKKKFKFFDLLYTIEQAKECHVISSSFLSLFMCNKFNKNVVAHMYTNRRRMKFAKFITKDKKIRVLIDKLISMI